MEGLQNKPMEVTLYQDQIKSDLYQAEKEEAMAINYQTVELRNIFCVNMQKAKCYVVSGTWLADMKIGTRKAVKSIDHLMLVFMQSGIRYRFNARLAKMARL
ncbi:hypothetical protein CEXT_529561 [Caerostris extrusa]|uniref:Uncharacterized protein n=1 Tax=Caerostris extrusa TaxID=172846 RepID=A0AAV4NFP7_CAEEX|nr:hypothetical protein CEXT_529561 [Caerostris extrusa]